jgi:hypothetical protein
MSQKTVLLRCFGENFSKFFSKITYKGYFHSRNRLHAFSHENTPYRWFLEKFSPKNAKVRFFGSPCTISKKPFVYFQPEKMSWPSFCLFLSNTVLSSFFGTHSAHREDRAQKCTTSQTRHSPCGFLIIDWACVGFLVVCLNLKKQAKMLL